MKETTPYGLTKAQASAIRCAHADLVGAYQCAIRDRSGGADNGHDWDSHRASIEELEREFPELLEHVPLDDEDESGDAIEAPADNAMNCDEWMEQFEPVLKDDGSLLEIDRDAENFQQLARDQRVWTMLDCDGDLYLSPGVHWVNRLSYHVTAKPWTLETPDVAWDVRDQEDNNEEDN